MYLPAAGFIVQLTTSKLIQFQIYCDTELVVKLYLYAEVLTWLCYGSEK